MSFYYDGEELEIINTFGVTFTTDGSYHETRTCLTGKELKAKNE